MSRVFRDHSFLLTSPLKTKTRVMALLVLAQLKSSSNLIEIEPQPDKNYDILHIANGVLIRNKRLYYIFTQL